MDTKSKCSESNSTSSSYSSMIFVKSNTDTCEYSGSTGSIPCLDPSKCDNLIDAVYNQSGIRGQLILYQSGTGEIPIVLLQNSLSVLDLQCTLNQDYRTQEYSFCIGKEIICQSGQRKFDSKQDAKHELAQEAYDLLKKDCFILKRIRDHTDIRESDLVNNEKAVKSLQSLSDFNTPGSMAHKMMMKMGWSGGGLGSREQGRVDNVPVYENVERRGFGNKNILKEVTKVLRDFSNSNKFTILAFDSSFSKAEREIIHKAARRMNLKSKSEGKGVDRRITVSRKINRWDIVRELLKAGGESSSYLLEIPDNFKHLLK